MDITEYKNIYELEDEHWWYAGMRHIFITTIRSYIKNNEKIKILDVGCGTGYNIKIMRKFGEVYGIDYSKEAIKFCKLNKVKNVKIASAEKIPFKDNTFDLVTSFEVLYHKGIKDDNKALQEIKRVCKKNGIIVIRLPAFNILKRKHDNQVHGIRRYNKKAIIKMCKNLNIKIEKITYLNALPFLPLVIIASLERIFNPKVDSDIKKTNKLINNILKYYLLLEGKIINKINLPFGTSILF